MNKTIIIVLLLIGSVHLAFAQKRAAWINAADTALYAEQDYYKAFKYYETALLYDTTDIDLWYRKAEAARQFNAYYHAEKAYLKVINSDRLSNYPCALAYAGQMRLSMGGYNKAEEYFQQFRERTEPGTDECKAMVDKGLENIAFARGDDGRVTSDVNPLNLGGPVNTSFSDFGVYPIEDGFYYSRYEYADYNNKKAPGRRYARIYKVTEGGAPELLPKYINLDTSLHVAHTTFNRDASRFYFTICNYTDGIDIHCDLYYREANGKGGWEQAVPVREVNQKGSTTTQPTIAWSEEQNREVLYFVSNRSGGQGGMDIWQSEIIDGQHQAPTNLGALVNTAGDEVTPFYHLRSQRLFFSSNGHPGYGGYDVFLARKNAEEWSELENMGGSVNASTDEVYYALDALGAKAYFSSNRLGATLFEVVEEEEDRLKEACCLDIYSYETPPCDLMVNTFRACDENGNYGEALNAVRLQFFDITDGEPGTLLHSDLNQTGNDMQFSPLQPYRKYKIIASKDKFEDATAILDFTNGDLPCQNGKSETLDICLQESCPQPSILAQVLNPSGEKVEEVQLRMVKLSTTGQFPIAVSEFERPNNNLCPEDLITVYGRFPGEEIINPGQDYPIEYDTYYGLVATKDLFTFDTTTVYITRGEVEGPDCVKAINLQIEPLDQLSELTLYFDNDSPHPDTRRITSDSNYIQVYNRFYQKKALFREQFSTDPADFLESQNLEAFFERELRANADRLSVFSDSLLMLLCQGAAINLEINGCASPRFNDFNNNRQRTYNVALTERRMDSVLDFIKEYRQESDGPLVFDQFLGGQLRIVPVEKECQVAARQELSDLNDLKNSIFSIDASVARRVEVRVKFRTQQ